MISSILYYEYNESPISDMKYDALSKQLVELSSAGIAGSQYEYVFHDFDGSTGFDLRGRLTPKDNEYLTHLSFLVSGRRVVPKKKPKKGALF